MKDKIKSVQKKKKLVVKYYILWTDGPYIVFSALQQAAQRHKHDRSPVLPTGTHCLLWSLRPEGTQPLPVSLPRFLPLLLHHHCFKFPELASLYSKKTSTFSCVRALHLHFSYLKSSTFRPLCIQLLFILGSVLCLPRLWPPYLREPLLLPLVTHYHIALLLSFTALPVIRWGGAMVTPSQRQY